MAIITGDTGADTLYDTADSDTIEARAGNDRITLSLGGNDTVSAGSGFDTLVIDWSALTQAIATITAPTADAFGGYSGQYSGGGRSVSYTEVERFEITAGSGNDTITTADGDDRISGSAGDDILVAGGGNDRLDGGLGWDRMSGGRGNDLYIVDNGDWTTELAGEGIDTVETALSVHTLMANVENLVGTGFQQTLTGNDGWNRITGGSGADTLRGKAGLDLLVGGAGGDTLEGGDDSDLLIAGQLSGPNLIVNGSFETQDGTNDARTWIGGNRFDLSSASTTSLFGWQSANDVPFQLVTAPGTHGTFNTGDGHVVLDLENGAGQRNAIFQDITGVAEGTPLVLSFTASSSAYGSGSAVLEVLWNGVTIAAVGAETAAVQYSFLVTAAAVGTGANGANRLEFRELGAGVDAYGTQLDAVSLHAVTSGDQMSNRLMGDAGDDTLLGDIGNDELFGGAGTDRMIGGAGDDKYWVEEATDVLVEQSGGGVDWVITTLSSFTLADNFEDLTGTSETGQTLVGNGVYNRIQGGWGNDRIDGGGAGDFLAGGRGDDTFLNVDASDIIFEMADQGIDTIETALAEYSLAGSNHIENLTGTNAAGQSLTGSAIANRLQGAGGNDVLNGNGGADTMAGGAGNDTYIVDSLDDVVEEHAGGGTDEVRTAVGSRSDPSQMYTLAAGVEKLTGTSTAGQGVYLNALNNVVKMGAGADLIVLEQGGNDQVDGGAGDDFFYYGGAFTAEDITVGGDGADTVGLLGTYDLVLGAQSLSGVEKLAVYSSGNAAAPNSYKITTADANVASGGRLTVIGQSLAANESLIFNGQAESNGSFTLRGGSGSDSFTGGLKNDILRGDAGADTLKGGGGNDQFDYYAAADSTAAARDTILDFSAGDRINLGGIDADGNAANGNGKFAFIGSGAFTGAAGQLRVTQAQGGGFLVEADVNGDKAADLVIQVHTLNNHILGAADIFL